MEQLQYEYNCPYCGELISAFLDLSVPKQNYIEDCEVCCNPINIKFVTDTNVILNFEAVQTE
jgi:transcription elongation factor Elf1